MRKFLLFACALSISLVSFAQPAHKNVARHVKKDVAFKKPAAVENTANFLEKRANPTVKSSLAVFETQIGNTRYDLQTNQSNCQRIYEFGDGTIGATWTFGLADPNFTTDRGTGYNYYDGTAWGAEPTQRIEDIRVGWPSYCPWGANGEVVVTHTSLVDGYKLSKRGTKGTGNWEWSTKPGPTGHENILWPRAVSSGANNEYLHIIGLIAPTANGGTIYNGQDGALFYNRTDDGGATWSINNVQLPNTDTAYYYQLGGDNYAFAAKGQKLAFLYGDDFTDIFLMKSEDNGATWTKKMIFQHPYPKFKETHTLVLDTPWVCDGGLAVALDNNGNAHITFGCMRVLNDDTTDGTTSYFPYSDGLAYWNETMPQLTSCDPDVLFAENKLVGWTQDVNGNDTIFEYVDIGLYYLSITGMPTMTIDDDNKIYVFFTSVVEGLDNGIQNYRHVYYRRSEDMGASWTDFNDITGSIVHNFHECVFPSVSPTSDDEYLHLLYQQDEEPGLAVRGDEDPYGDNFMIHVKVPKFNVGIQDPSGNIAYVTQNYPNPFHGTSVVAVNLTKPCELSLEVVNSLGQKVFEIPASNAGMGNHLLTIDGTDLEPGIYFYTVKAGTYTTTHKMMVK